MRFGAREGENISFALTPQGKGAMFDVLNSERLLPALSGYDWRTQLSRRYNKKEVSRPRPEVHPKS